MKKSITYREVTVAIGILVAMLVAMTLWIGFPEKEIAEIPGGAPVVFSAAKKLFQDPQLLLSW